MSGRYPQRDHTHPDGIYWSPMHPPAMPRAHVTVHQHTCPDGIVVEAHSQWLVSLGRTLDRWVVGGITIATSARDEPNTTPPDFTWADERARHIAA